MISVRGVSKYYDNELLLKNLNFEVKKGETLVLVGPSGKGKSTLLKMLAGVVLPSSGEITIDSINLNSTTDEKRTALLRRMGMLFQKNALFDSLTVGENIAFPLRETTQLSEDEIQKKISFYLEAVALAHARLLYPDELSGGMQKRLGIARALALDPEIILYDDPTAGLDPITSRKIVKLIIDLKQQRGSTVVAITNDMNRAYQMADRIAMIVGTEMIECGSPEQTKKHHDPRVKQFILGELEGPLTVAR